MAANPLINGVKHDHSSVEVKADGGPVIDDIKSIKYSHKLESGDVRGTGAQRVGRTRGEYSAEGSLEMTFRAAQALRARLGAGYLERSFDITSTWADDDGDGVVTDLLRGCRIKSEETSSSTGNEPVMVTFELDIMYLLLDGQEPVRNMKR